MKNLMVANLNEKSKRYNEKALFRLLKAQIENSIDCGWNPKDIILLANCYFEFMGVKAIKIPLNDFCWTGSKVFGVKWLFENTDINDVVWARDLDAWQNVPFNEPQFKDVGASRYSRPKFNGGSVFWKKSALDILNYIVKLLTDNKEAREEPTLNKVFKSDEYKDRVTILNETYNLGCSGFVPRYERSFKPIKVCHFHPYNRIAWETHTMDRNDIGVIPVTRRLERVIRKYYNLPIKLKGGKKHGKKN